MATTTEQQAMEKKNQKDHVIYQKNLSICDHLKKKKKKEGSFGCLKSKQKKKKRREKKSLKKENDLGARFAWFVAYQAKSYFPVQ